MDTAKALRRRGSAAAVVIIVLAVAGIAVTFYFYHRHDLQKRVEAYQREQAEIKKADAARRAEADAAARARAEAEAELARVEAEAEAKRDAERAAAARKSAVQEKYAAAEGAFRGAKVEEWTRGAADASKPAWCLVQQSEEDAPRLFEVEAKSGDATRVVRYMTAAGAEESMPQSEFAKRHLSGESGWLVMSGGRTMLHAPVRGRPAERLQVPAEGEDGFDVAEHVYGGAAKAIRRLGMTPPGIEWNVTFVTKLGREVPVGSVDFGGRVTRAMFRPAVKEVLDAAAANMVVDRPAAQAAPSGGATATAVPSSFAPSKKRTHFLYDKGKIKRTVDGLVYVPRAYKTAKKEFSRNKRQQEQDEERDALHRAEWQALYNEALRQEKEEAAERAAWERARRKGAASAAAPRPRPDRERVVATSAHLEKALDEGTFKFSRAEK